MRPLPVPRDAEAVNDDQALFAVCTALNHAALVAVTMTLLEFHRAKSICDARILYALHDGWRGPIIYFLTDDDTRDKYARRLQALALALAIAKERST